MKRTEEYLKDLFEEPFNLEDQNSIEYDFYLVLQQAQIDAIKATVQACADNADADYTFINNNSDIEVYVIKSSILEMADKLIKELE